MDIGTISILIGIAILTYRVCLMKKIEQPQPNQCYWTPGLEIETAEILISDFDVEPSSLQRDFGMPATHYAALIKKHEEGMRQQQLEQRAEFRKEQTMRRKQRDEIMITVRQIDNRRQTPFIEAALPELLRLGGLVEVKSHEEFKQISAFLSATRL